MTTIEIDSVAPSSLVRPSPRWLLVHYVRPDGDYAAWSLHAWGDIEPGQIDGYPAGRPFAGEDSYGRFAWVALVPGARDVGFLVADRSGAKDVAHDRHVDPAEVSEIWLRPGDPEIYTSPPSPIRSAINST